MHSGTKRKCLWCGLVDIGRIGVASFWASRKLGSVRDSRSGYRELIPSAPSSIAQNDNIPLWGNDDAIDLDGGHRTH